VSTINKRSVLGQVFLIAFLDIVGFSILFPLFPHMLDHYLGLEGTDSMIGRLTHKLGELAGDAGPSETLVATLFGGILGSLYSLLQFAFAPVWGAWSDRSGRRPILLFTLCGTALAYVLWFFAGTFGLLIVSRLVGGIMAGNISTATAVVADVTEPGERSKGMGLIGAAIGLGFIFGPAIGGLTAQLDLAAAWPGGAELGVNPFSGAALAALLLSLLNLFLVATRFPETRRAGTHRAAPREGGRTANPLKIFAGVRAPGVPRTNTTYFLFLVAFSASEFTLVFLTLERFQWTPLQNAWMFVYVGLIIALVQGGLLRRLAPRFDDRALARAGIFLVAPGLVLVGIAETPGMLYAGLALLAIGSALVMPTLGALVSRYAPEDQQGLAMGLFRSTGALSRAVGPILGGVLFWQLGSRPAYLLCAAALALPLFLVLSLPPAPEHAPAESGGQPEPA